MAAACVVLGSVGRSLIVREVGFSCWAGWLPGATAVTRAESYVYVIGITRDMIIIGVTRHVTQRDISNTDRPNDVSSSDDNIYRGELSYPLFKLPCLRVG